jgi:glyoxylase-like metal-dependent hydrolase (beta-lactamase superfamily II)
MSWYVLNSHRPLRLQRLFQQATVIIHALEIEAPWRLTQPGSVMSGRITFMPMTTISNQTDVMGDGRIVLVPLPGHTPGTIGALIELDRSGRFLLASDALSIRENLDREIIPRNTWNADLCERSFNEIKTLEASGYKIICSHDAAQWEQLRKGRDAFD